MANLEILVSELPTLIQSLKLTIGDSNEISDITHLSLTANLQVIAENLKINLDFGNSNILQRQIQKN